MQTAFIKRPYNWSQKRAYSPRNIFDDDGVESEYTTQQQNERKTLKVFDYVGPSEIREKLIEENQGQSKCFVDSLDQLQVERIQTDIHKTLPMTIRRDTVRSKLSQYENQLMTRDVKNLKYFKEYQQKWQKEMLRIKQATGKTFQPTLLETVKKSVKVMPNPQKQDILKDYVENYWEMSLRNNNIILKRHLKGNNRYSSKQEQELLQREEGRKQVQASIPKLPLEQLKRLQLKDISLSGRNKLASESYSCDPSIVSQYTSRLSKAMTQRSSSSLDQEILKIHYDSAHQYMKKEVEY